MESLLPYFEHELSLFNKQSKAFANKYPKIANRLLMAHDTVDDPHIERLIQAFSLISARINKKLDDSYADFTESLLEVIYPDYLKPFPSVSIAQYNLGIQASSLSEPTSVPRHSMFATKKIKGTSCQFKSTQDVTLYPLEVKDIVFERGQEKFVDGAGYLNGCIKIIFNSLNEGFDLNVLVNNPLDVYIDEDASQGASLWDLLSYDVKLTEVQGLSSYEVVGSIFDLIGFEPAQQILPDENVSNAAPNLLKEYFYFPQKFNFLRLNFSKLPSNFDFGTKNFEIRCYFKFDKKNTIKLKNLQQLSSSSIKLFCTPVVNLFESSGKPILVNQTQVYYDLVPDTHSLYQYEIYSVQDVIESKHVDNRLQQKRYHPFYALKHFEQNDDGRYYHVTRDKEMADFQQGYEYQIMFVEKNKKEGLGTVSMSTSLLCTNRDLPSQVLFGQNRGDLFTDNATGYTSISFLQQPTKTARFEYTGDERWRLISLISLNFLALASQNAELMKEYLALYDIKQSAANKKLIDGIVSVNTDIITRRIQRNPQPGYIRGTLVEMSIDIKQFNEVSIRQLAHLLSCVFGYHASLNSFVELVLINANNKEEIHRCQPRSGLSPLI